jgi:uncharacterized protein YcbX
MGTPIGTIASIHRFPVKSMQGEVVEQADIDADGIVGDRVWALRDAETGKLVSAKRPRLWRSALDCFASGTGDDIMVTLPSGDSFGVDDPALRVSLNALFGRDVTIERSSRPQQGVYESDWPDIDGLTLSGELEFPTNLGSDGSRFVDVDMLHLVTSASLATLAAVDRDLDIDVRRFRPSFVVETPGLGGFPENDWEGKTLTIGEVEVRVGIPTPRCVMTTVTQPGLPRQPGVLQAIARHNRQTNALGAFACLGAYASVARPGAIRAGDEVTIG